MALKVITAFSFFSTVQVIYSILYYIYIVYVSQYPTRGDTETMRGYLETRPNLSILSNSMCDLANTILKNYFENGLLKYHQRKRFCY